MSDRFDSDSGSTSSVPSKGALGSHSCAISRPLSSAYRIVLFLPIAIIWLVVDIVTKNIANVNAVGDTFGPSIPGILEFRLVHNTGGAWGILGDMTLLLGLVSVLICVAIAIFVFAYRGISPLAIISLALVFAGGLGNAIDRFEYGYVVDMISTIFIDFPVFNVADIGVTCGIVLFVISIIFSKDCIASDGDSGVGASSASGRIKGKGD